VAAGDERVSGDYTPDPRIRQHHKDVRTIISQSPFEVLLTPAHERLLQDAVSNGDGDLDNAAIIRRWTRR